MAQDTAPAVCAQLRSQSVRQAVLRGTDRERRRGDDAMERLVQSPDKQLADTELRTGKVPEHLESRGKGEN